MSGATVGVEYERRQSGSNARWCARLPRRADLSGYGTTKPEALASLKTAYAWANWQPKQGVRCRKKSSNRRRLSAFSSLDADRVGP